MRRKKVSYFYFSIVKLSWEWWVHSERKNILRMYKVTGKYSGRNCATSLRDKVKLLEGATFTWVQRFLNFKEKSGRIQAEFLHSFPSLMRGIFWKANAMSLKVNYWNQAQVERLSCFSTVTFGDLSKYVSCIPKYTCRASPWCPGCNFCRACTWIGEGFLSNLTLWVSDYALNKCTCLESGLYRKCSSP